MFDVTLLILLGLAALGFISHNTTVAVSILVLIIVRVTPLSTFFPWIEKQGAKYRDNHSDDWRYGPHRQRDATALNLDSLVSELEIAGGNCSRRYCLWLGGRGVTLMGSQPQLVAGLLVGTVLGVALFRGVPVGPLIAAGLVSLIVGKQ